jgi:hypothetical protein
MLTIHVKFVNFKKIVGLETPSATRARHHYTTGWTPSTLTTTQGGVTS